MSLTNNSEAANRYYLEQLKNIQLTLQELKVAVNSHTHASIEFNNGHTVDSQMIETNQENVSYYNNRQISSGVSENESREKELQAQNNLFEAEQWVTNAIDSETLTLSSLMQQDSVKKLPREKMLSIVRSIVTRVNSGELSKTVLE